jgi:hypothetical protein
MLVVAIKKARAINTYTKNYFLTLKANYLTLQH